MARMIEVFGHWTEPADPQVCICAGPPTCLLEGDAAVEAMKAGCAWCTRVTLHADGSETTAGPRRA